jgi:DNA-binding LacI/PurR family transcriptional regulator
MAYLWYGNARVTSARQRRDGFYHALRALNGSGGDAAACCGSEYAHRDVEALMRALRSPDGPTAVFCYNDELGVDLVDRTHAAGLRVPTDVSIVGFDDNMLALVPRARA